MPNRTGPGKDRRKQAAFDTAVANKMGLAGWVMHGNSGGGRGTAAQQAAAKENGARAAMQTRNLPKAQKLVGQAIDQRMQALSPRGQQAEAGKGATPQQAQQKRRAHQRSVGQLRGVQQAMGDVSSAYFHEARKIDGDWPKKRK